MAELGFFSRAADHLGLIGKELRDLTGFATLAHELVQNADDAETASQVIFDVRDDALVVENDGAFTDCLNQESSNCPWLQDASKGHRCDFHSFRTVAGADKRRREETTGAFGVGFIAVYQITDKPELISAGRHWVIDEAAPEDRRIDGTCEGCGWCQGVTGTRFVLPWAMDPESSFRKALQAQAQTSTTPERLMDDIVHALPTAMIFLKRLTGIEVRRNGDRMKRLERVLDGDVVLISDGSTDRIWHLIRGDFENEASRLREQYGQRIEPKRSSEVTIAVPAETLETETGRLCAGLPTQDVTGLQFHVNADFFPSSDRKKIIFEADYQSEWNRAALAGAAEALTRDLERLTSLLGHSRFWEVLHSVGTVALEARKGRRDEALAYFWEQLAPKVESSRVFFTVEEDWVLASEAFVLESEREQDAVPALTALGIRIVHPAVRLAYYRHPYRDALGLRRLEAEHVVRGLRQLGLTTRTELAQMPGPLGALAGLRSLWTELNHLLSRASKPIRETAKRDLAECTLAPGMDGALWPCRDLLRAMDERAVGLFRRLDPSVAFLDQAVLGEEGEAVALLCPEFGGLAAVQVLESMGEEKIREAVESSRLVPDELLAWFETRIEEIRDSEELRERLRALPVYPSASGLQPLTMLSLPGDFQDPLGIAELVDNARLGEHRDLLHRLGAVDLSFAAYARDHIPRVFEEERLSIEQKRDVLELLATRLGEIRDEPDLRRILAGIPLIECEDGIYRSPEDVYFRAETTMSVLGDDIHLATLPSSHLDAVREFYRWLDVAEKPRTQDVIGRARSLTEGPPSENAAQAILRVLRYLGKTFDEEEAGGRWSELRSLAWLPAMNDKDRWYRPDELHAVFSMHLFESQAFFLDAPLRVQQESAKFLSYLGVREAPSVGQIVDHLLWCIDAGKAPHKDIYRRLNDSAEDGAILRLLGKKCILLDTGEIVGADQVFWSEPGLGRFRYRLSESLRSYGGLLARLGVKDAPDREDALRVLLEISAEYGASNSPVDDEDEYTVLIECWRRLSRALSTEELLPDDLINLKEKKVIPNARRVLTRPDRIYFEDRAGLSAKFGRFLEGNVIPRVQEAWFAMQSAGVQDLGLVVTAELVEADQAIEDTTISNLLSERRQQLARVFAAHEDVDIQGRALDWLAALRCLSVLELKVQWILRAFDKEISSETESVAAHFHQGDSCLYCVSTDGQLPWAAIARELALIASPESEPGALAPGIKEVLSAASLDEARRALDVLGVRPLELGPEGEPAESLMAADLGGEEGSPLGPEHHPSDSIRPSESVGGKLSGEASVEQQTIADEDELARTAESGLDEVTKSDRGTKPKERDRSPAGSSGKLRTYVVSEESEEVREPDHAAARHRSEIEQAGVRRVLEYEKAAGREPLEMPPLNPGYDVESRDGEGNLLRYIEIKSLRGTWTDADAPALTRTQFKRSEQEGEIFWLYVVERSQAEDFEIHCVPNPGRSVNQFIYDPGWRALAAETYRGTTERGD